MNKMFFLSIIVIICNRATAQYKSADIGSYIQFKIKNFGVSTGGSFTGLQGNIKFDINHPNDANFDVSIDANTINTGNDLRDRHLRNESYFDVRNYPRIYFVSTNVKQSVKVGELVISGKLTIKNQTKNISFPFTAITINDGYLFKGAFNINRRDFGVGGSSIISDDLEVELKVLAKK